MGTSVIPNLMPFQMLAFNGDHFLEETFLKLKEEFGITTVCETGTCLGSTAIWLMQNFKYVLTTEINKDFLKIADERISEALGPNKTAFNDTMTLGSVDSVEFLQRMGPELDDKTIFFLDAHWQSHCPLLEELEAIAEMKICPVIVVHDFVVPGRPDLGYDEYNGQKFELEWVYPQLEKIYKDCGMSIRYNDKATGAKRGVLIVCPLKTQDNANTAVSTDDLGAT